MRPNPKELDRVLDEIGLGIAATHLGRWAEPGERGEQDHWDVVLKRGKAAPLSTRFHMGIGLDGRAPTAAAVVYSLMSDGRAGELSFEEFCSEFGYDADSRRAEKIWKECKKIAPKIRKLLGAHFERVTEAAQDY